MFFTKKFVMTAIAVALSVIASTAGTAQATFMSGSFGYIPVGGVTYTPDGSTTISGAATVTIPATELVNNVPTTYLGGPNGFFGSPGLVNVGDTVSVSPLTLSTVSGPVSLTAYLTFDGVRFTYDMSSILWSTSASSNLSFVSLGTFHDASHVFADNAATLSGSFTQTGGPSGAVNGSFTFATPPPPVAPEPSSVLLLASGSAIIGLIARRRKLATRA